MGPALHHLARNRQAARLLLGALLLAVSAAATIAGTGVSAGEQAIAYGIFALIGDRSPR